MANLTTEQIIEAVGQAFTNNVAAPGGIEFNATQLGPFFTNYLTPALETLVNSQAQIDATATRAFTKFNLGDDIVENVMQKVTTPLWSNSTSSLSSFFTSSTQTASAAGKYYYDVYQKGPTAEGAAVQFSIAYGHRAGSGSAGTTDNRPTKAIYSQYVQTVLNPGDTKFTFTSSAAGTYDDDFYAINVSRALYKERIDPGNWELRLSGSGGTNPSKSLELIDDSGQSTAAGTGSQARVYNIVSGTIDGGQAGSEKYGLIYPDVGLIVLDGRITSSVGWHTTASAPGPHPPNHELFLDSIVGGAHFKARSEEDVTSTHYFCRIKAGEYNYTNNSTWADQATGIPVNAGFKSDPKSYITTVGLYNDAKELLAVAKLSKPLLKSFSREAVIKVKLDF